MHRHRICALLALLFVLLFGFAFAELDLKDVKNIGSQCRVYRPLNNTTTDEDFQDENWILELSIQTPSELPLSDMLECANEMIPSTFHKSSEWSEDGKTLSIKYQATLSDLKDCAVSDRLIWEFSINYDGGVFTRDACIFTLNHDIGSSSFIKEEESAPFSFTVSDESYTWVEDTVSVRSILTVEPSGYIEKYLVGATAKSKNWNKVSVTHGCIDGSIDVSSCNELYIIIEGLTQTAPGRVEDEIKVELKGVTYGNTERDMSYKLFVDTSMSTPNITTLNALYYDRDMSKAGDIFSNGDTVFGRLNIDDCTNHETHSLSIDRIDYICTTRTGTVLPPISIYNNALDVQANKDYEANVPECNSKCSCDYSFKAVVNPYTEKGCDLVITYTYDYKLAPTTKSKHAPMHTINRVTRVIDTSLAITTKTPSVIRRDLKATDSSTSDGKKQRTKGAVITFIVVGTCGSIVVVLLVLLTGVFGVRVIKKKKKGRLN